MKKAYFVILVDGGGDTTVKLVDQETWDWINNPDKGREETFQEKTAFFSRKKQPPTRWDDNICPESIRNRIEKERGTPDVFLTQGSWKNDRVILAPHLEDDIEFYRGGSTKERFEMFNEAEKRGYEVDLDNEYEGGMY